MSGAILVLNSGSSSIKFALYAADRTEVLVRGGVQDIGANARVAVNGPCSAAFAMAAPPPADATHQTVIAWLVKSIRSQLSTLTIVGAGHRVVHGGTRFVEPARIDEDMLAELDTLVELAPGHEPHNIAAIRAVAASWPELPQVACFDTAFHHTQPRIARLFGLPKALSTEGIVRYGFHGLSYEYIASALPEHLGARADGKIIVAHLGNGASMCGMRGRRSVATTMGFTALDGLMMGTRCGALDPGVVLHLQERKGMSAAEVSDLLYNKSGLLGVSGMGSDVRALEVSGDPSAAEALDLFAYRASLEIGSLTAALGGLDALVFTAGIGEHSVEMRRRICDRTKWAGVALDGEANARSATIISIPAAAVPVLVIPTDEELVIARSTRKIIQHPFG